MCKENIPFVTLMTQWSPNVSHIRGGVCEVLADETVDHSLQKEDVTDSLWRYFVGAAGLLGPWVHEKQFLIKRLNDKGNSRQRYHLMQYLIVSFKKEKYHFTWSFLLY